MENKQYLTVKEVAVLLGIAEKTVRKYVWQKSIPYVKICGHVRFNQKRLEAWLEQRQVPTIEEILNRKNTKNVGRAISNPTDSGRCND